MHSRAEIARDFDRIAPLEHAAKSRLTHAERWLLAQVPPHVRVAVDLGSGAGALARAVAARTGGTVLALDASPNMLAHARAAGGVHAVHAVRADVAAPPLAASSVDCVLAVAVLHHLPEPAAVIRHWATLLRPGGLLLVQDILDRSGWRSVPINALAMLAAFPNRARAVFSPTGRALWKAYQAHGASERYLTRREAEALPGAADLPSAKVRAHLGWRYSLVWRKPTAGVA